MPKPASQPRAAAAEKQEEAPAEVTIDFGGHKFKVPKNRDEWSTRAMLTLTRARTLQQQVAAIEEQIGPDEWEILVETAAPTRGEFNAFVKLFFKVVNDECEG